jgi:hypothetical protein
MKVTFFFSFFLGGGGGGGGGGEGGVGGLETTQIEANWKEEKRSLFPFFTFLVLLS